MQPYFFPYLGYFRLFASVDLFVIYDCVQFPRRGWVHRNRVLFDSRLEWITLPIQKSPQSTKIYQLQFQQNSAQWYLNLIHKIGRCSFANGGENFPGRDILMPSGEVVDYLEKTLVWSCEALEISTQMVRSSMFNLDECYRGQDRILELCRVVGATEYLNLPGGLELYDQEAFKSANVELAFLPVFEGSHESLLGRCMKEPHVDLRKELFT